MRHKVAYSAAAAMGLVLGSRMERRVEGLVLKLVNPVAVECLGGDLILALHHNAPAPVNGKNEEGVNGLCVQGFGNRKHVVNKPVGVISPDFARALQAYGVGITRSEMQKAPNYSGGHANLRYAVDLLQSEAIESSLQRAVALAKDGRDVMIVDVGAKFRKIANIVERRLTASF